MTTTKPEFVYVTYISTTPEKVWAALTDGELTKQFWGRHRNVSDWKVGSSWSHQDYDDASVVDVDGKVIESDPPRRLVLTWQGTSEERRKERPSRVTFQIDPVFGAVRLTVTHDELDADSTTFRAVSGGWPAILSSLKTLLETGSAMPMTGRRWGGPPPEDARP